MTGVVRSRSLRDHFRRRTNYEGFRTARYGALEWKRRSSIWHQEVIDGQKQRAHSSMDAAAEDRQSALEHNPHAVGRSRSHDANDPARSGGASGGGLSDLRRD